MMRLVQKRLALGLVLKELDASLEAGYLVGTLDRFNDAKRAEERERVKHMEKS